MKKLLRPIFRLFQRGLGVAGMRQDIEVLTNELASAQQAISGLASLVVQRNQHMFDHVDIITKERGEAFQEAAKLVARTELQNESKFIRDELQREVSQLQRKIDAARASGLITTSAAPAPTASSPTIDDTLYKLQRGL